MPVAVAISCQYVVTLVDRRLGLKYAVKNTTNLQVTKSYNRLKELTCSRVYQRSTTPANQLYFRSVARNVNESLFLMMTSSNGNIFRVTGYLCGEFTGPRWIPRTKASDAELWCFLRSAPNKRLSKQWWGWWFETPSCPLWRHRNDMEMTCWLNLSSEGVDHDHNPSHILCVSCYKCQWVPCTEHIRNATIKNNVLQGQPKNYKEGQNRRCPFS